ncbi:Golgi pH regulator B isoform X1 [Papio anubis]|uniref:Golgi pH regulator B isoform X1 n=1 Tax=Papio anubis TaxID=9555 RepID=UPI0012AE5CE1|nr:Golgi pH regulator B isoform X1 [Papio anubis]
MSFLIDSSITITSQILFFGFGWLFFMRQLFKDYEDLSATLLCKLGPGQSEIAEELCQRLQRKERMLQDLLSDRNKQVVEHEMEIQGLLQSMSTREQESQKREDGASLNGKKFRITGPAPIFRRERLPDVPST